MPHEKCPMARVLRGETLKAGDLEVLVEEIMARAETFSLAQQL